jgi:MFS family permease
MRGGRTTTLVLTPFAAATVVGVTQGITYPLFTLLLTERGVSGTAAGVNGAMTPLGMVIAAPFLPALVRLVRLRLVAAAALVGISTFVAGLALSSNVLAWAVFRFGLGACAVAVYIVSETWLSLVVRAQSRARMLAVYTAVLCTGFCVGPVLLTTGTTAVLTTAMLCPLLTAVPLLLNRHGEPAVSTAGEVPLGQLLRGLSPLLVPVIAVSVFDVVALQFLPAYGVRSGLSPNSAALLLSVLLVGQIVMPLPLGWLADKVSIRKALKVSLTGGALGALLLPSVLHLDPWALIFVAVWGGVASAGYPLALTVLGSDCTGANLVTANTAFAIVWGIGGVVGPPYSGAALDLIGTNGIPLAVSLLFIAGLAVLIVRDLRQQERHDGPVRQHERSRPDARQEVRA